MPGRLLILSLIEMTTLMGMIAWLRVRVLGKPIGPRGGWLWLVGIVPIIAWGTRVRSGGVFSYLGGLLDMIGLVAMSVSATVVIFEGVRVLRQLRARPSSDAPPLPERRDVISTIAGSTAAAVTAGPLLWGFAKTRFDVEVVEVPIRLPRLPKALDGYAIVQVSDLHVGAWFGERELRRAEEMVARLRPDLVVMTGDLLQRELHVLDMAVASIARMAKQARHGGCGIPGNHEYYAGHAAVMSALARAGIYSLVNQGRVIAPADGGIAMVGVDDLYGSMSGKGPGPRPAIALSTLPPDLPRILLCHQPQWLPRASSYGFDLMLSGHTHGGQVAPPGAIFGKWVFGNVAGWARYENTQLYVNRGLGTSGPPTRVLVRPEITKIVLVAA